MTTLFIALTSADANLRLRTAVSVASLTASLVKSRIGYAIRARESSDIVSNRNTLASEFLGRPEFTHLLFVDWDIEFDPAIIGFMVKMNRPLVGAVYPKRGPNKEGFAVEPLSPQPAPKNGVAEVAGIGMGLCLIARAVFAKLTELPDMRVRREGDKTNFGFFDQMRDGDRLLSEDISFCQRWRRCGGQVVGITNGNIGHVDTNVLRGQWNGEVAPSP